MKLKFFSIAVLVLIQGLTTSGLTTQTPQTPQPPTASATALAEIKTYTAEIDRVTKKQNFRTYGIIYNGNDGTWQLLKPKSEHVNESCDVWTREGKVVLAFFGFTSDSGDWYHFIKYYYRPDGTLAKIQARLNTFYGNVSVLRDRYYDTNGKLLKSTQRYLDMQTQKPVKKADFHDNPIPMYARVSALPFRKLL